MAQSFGIEVPAPHDGGEPQAAVRYVVLIDSASEAQRVARLFLADRTQVAEFDASAPEVQQLIDGLLAERAAQKPEWDRALGGHDAAERAGAEIYTLAL